MTSPYLTDERLMIQAAAREFTMNEVLPVANELDPIQGEIPMDLRRKLGELGYFGIRTPEEYGGLGLGVFEYCMIAEELARGWMSVASIIARAGGVMARRRLAAREAHRADAQSRARRISRGGIAVGTERRLGPRRRELPCGARWRRMGHHRQQVLVHVRRRRRLHPIARARRGARRRSALQRPAHVHHRKTPRRVAERMRRLADSEDRLLRLENVRTRVRRLPHSEGEHHHRRRFAKGSRTRCRSSIPRARIRRRARSDSRAARWRTRWRMPTSASSSAFRSRIFRRRVSRSRAWRARSKPRAN